MRSELRDPSGPRRVATCRRCRRGSDPDAGYDRSVLNLVLYQVPSTIFVRTFGKDSMISPVSAESRRMMTCRVSPNP